MSANKFTSPLKHPWLYFALVFVPAVLVFTLYAINIVQWRNSPDFGWRPMYESGPNIAADLFDRARAAGMQPGDEIRAINGKKYSTFEELFFEVRNETPDSVNTYSILRDGKELKINITTRQIGLLKVLQRSGPMFSIGFIYFLIGVLVYLMKPGARESFLFLLQASFLGAMICYQSPSDLFRPLWLFDVRNFIEVFMPAPMMHLALRFPKTRSFLVKLPQLVVVPYLLAITLLIAMKLTSTAYWNIPPALNGLYNLSILLSVLTFLVSVVWNYLKDDSAAVKLQSQAILVGIFLGFFIPVADLVVRAYLNIHLFPDPVIGFMIFLTFFPLSIGFTIVKYDLFAIDTVIKRTYGYLLTTGAIAGIYAIVLSISNLAFGRFAITESPLFPLFFILAVVFFLNPVRNRLQKVIDRVFYRLEYDYQDTVQKISETMRTLLGFNDIGKGIMQFSLGTMFIDAGSVFLLNTEEKEYECLIEAGEREHPRGQNKIGAIVSGKTEAPEKEKKKGGIFFSEKGNGLTEFRIPADEPFLQRLAEKKKEVTVYDIQANPFYKAQRESGQQIFDQLGGTLIIPLIYEDRLTGLISLGRKKSGKFYRREDINLLMTLANQSAMAIENARMVGEIIEKERSKIKIMESFGKYVTPEVRDQILEGRIPLDGETKDVTVLFADLRGFTTMTESSDPKQVVEIINFYFSEMADAIGEHNGLVMQFIGDEIEAVFGAPLPLEGHATHAVRAALAMRKRLVLVNQNLEMRGYQPLRHGIGVHTGNVVAANIGSEDRLSYAMVGDTVNVASRIQDLNKEFGTDILISATTLERQKEFIKGEKLGSINVKGKKDPVEIFKLT